MLRRVLTSSSIVSVGYDQAAKTLEVEFWQGETYMFSGVERQVYDDLVQAASPGDFFNSHVRDSYESRRVS